LLLADALSAVADAEQRLWTPEGADALEYLRRDRGLRDETIRAARLGFADKLRLPKRDGSGTWPVSGITLPWFDRDRLARVKIRRLGLINGAKYIEAFADRPWIYPGPEGIRTAKPLIVTEGEFDALLLGQELGELAAVVTLGSASARPEGSTYLAMLPAPTWFLALDADDAGDKAASGWPARARRVRPPVGKDWTEARPCPWRCSVSGTDAEAPPVVQAGVDLRRWWIEEVFPLDGPFAIEERAAIQESRP
jgi:DNA primase